MSYYDPEPPKCPVCGLNIDGDCSEDHEREYIVGFDQFQPGIVQGYTPLSADRNDRKSASAER